jgi:hypothetical protein
MARGLIASVTDAITGVNPVPTSADEANNHYFPWTEDAVLECRNNSVSSANVTVVTNADADGNAVSDLVVAVPAASTRRIGPFKSSIYRQTDGNVQVNISEDTTFLFGVSRTPRNS